MPIDPEKIILETTYSDFAEGTVRHKHVLHQNSDNFILYNRWQIDGTGWATKTFIGQNIEKAIKFFLKEFMADRKSCIDSKNMIIVNPVYARDIAKHRSNPPIKPIENEKFPNWKAELNEIEEIGAEYFGVLSSSEYTFYKFAKACSSSNYKTAIEAFPQFYTRMLEHARETKEKLRRGH